MKEVQHIVFGLLVCIILVYISNVAEEGSTLYVPQKN
jgi:hypothetical protein